MSFNESVNPLVGPYDFSLCNMKKFLTELDNLGVEYEYYNYTNKVEVNCGSKLSECYNILVGMGGVKNFSVEENCVILKSPAPNVPPGAFL